MKQFIKENWFKLSIIILLMVGLSVVYYSLIIQPAKQASPIQQTNNDQQKLEQLVKEQKDRTNDLFQKNTECAKYKDTILGKIDQFNKNQKPELRNTDNADIDGKNPMYRTFIDHKDLKDLFYSSKINSCLYLEDDSTLIKIDSGTDEGRYITDAEYYFLYNAFNDQTVDIINTPAGETTMKPSDIDEFVNKYKDN